MQWCLRRIILITHFIWVCDEIRSLFDWYWSSIIVLVNDCSKVGTRMFETQTLSGYTSCGTIFIKSVWKIYSEVGRQRNFVGIWSHFFPKRPVWNQSLICLQLNSAGYSWQYCALDKNAQKFRAVITIYNINVYWSWALDIPNWKTDSQLSMVFIFSSRSLMNQSLLFLVCKMSCFEYFFAQIL